MCCDITRIFNKIITVLDGMYRLDGGNNTSPYFAYIHEILFFLHLKSYWRLLQLVCYIRHAAVFTNI